MNDLVGGASDGDYRTRPAKVADGVAFQSAGLWAAVALVFSVLPARAEPPQAVPVDGKPFRAELASVADWQLTFKPGGPLQTLPAASLVRWGQFVDPLRGPVVVLADGGRLVGPVLRADRSTVVAEPDLLTPAAGGELKLPATLVAGVVFQLPTDSRQRDLLFDRLAAPGAVRDRLLMASGDEVTGTLQGIADGAIQMATDVGLVKVEFHRAQAVILDPARRKPPAGEGLRAWAGLRDGTLLVAQGLALSDNAFSLVMAGGLKLAAQPRDLVYLQPTGGRAVYLSDLAPAAYRFVPFLDLAWPYRTDRAVTGERLRAGGRTYLKGIGVHSASQLSYTLDGAYRRFDAELAIDDSTGGRGSVRFRVFVDGSEKYASGPVRGGDPPVPVSVDLTGAKTLELIVVYGERGDELDRAVWLDARLVK